MLFFAVAFAFSLSLALAVALLVRCFCVAFALLSRCFRDGFVLVARSFHFGLALLSLSLSLLRRSHAAFALFAPISCRFRLVLGLLWISFWFALGVLPR